MQNRRRTLWKHGYDLTWSNHQECTHSKRDALYFISRAGMVIIDLAARYHLASSSHQLQKDMLDPKLKTFRP